MLAKLATFVGALVLCGVASAGAIDQLNRFVKETRSADGRFVQRVTAGTRAKDENSEGRFAFERPGRFRWVVESPFEQLMVADGKQVYFLDKDLNQVTVRPLQDAMGATPAAILFGASDLDSRFEILESGTAQGLDWLDAVPRDKEAGFERIRIGFADGLPRKMVVQDAFGRTLSFEFVDLRANPALSADLFRFTVPEGADVVKQ